MGERKVINHYFPPNFDPSQIPRRKPRGKNPQVKVNMMIDMKLKCTVCGEYMNPGSKFNSRKETVVGEDYLGIKVFRFYIRCNNCYAELTFKTDPKNACYVAENNCEKIDMPWHLHARLVEQQQDEMANADAIQQLEQKTISGKKEMEDLDMLQELRDLQAQNSKIPSEKLLELIHQKAAAAAAKGSVGFSYVPNEVLELPLAGDEEDEEEIDQQVDESMFVKRLQDDEEEQKSRDTLLNSTNSDNNNNDSSSASILVSTNNENSNDAVAKKRKRETSSAVEFVVVSKKSNAKKQKKQGNGKAKSNSLASLGGYSDD